MAGVTATGLVEQADCRADLARRAVAALETVVSDEGGLHGVELVARGQALDRGDPAAFDARGEREAGQHAAPIDEHRAGAALALIAALLRAGQLESLAERIQQDDARIELQRSCRSIDIERHLDKVLCRGRLGEHRLGRGRQRGEGIVVRQQLEGECAEAARDRSAQELTSRRSDIGQRRDLFEQRLFVGRQLGLRRVVGFITHGGSADDAGRKTRV